MDKRNKFSCLAQNARCALTGLSLLVTSCSSQLSGRLIDEMSEPINSRDATVNIVRLDSDASPVRLVIPVTPDGHFIVSDSLAKGMYLVEVMVPGYQVQSEKIKLESQVELEFVLSKLLSIETGSAIHSHLSIPTGRGEGNASLTPPRL